MYKSLSSGNKFDVIKTIQIKKRKTAITLCIRPHWESKYNDEGIKYGKNEK